MFEAFRHRFANRLVSIANRVTNDQRFPGSSRVAQVTRTLAGVQITPDTAVQVASVWACIRYLSQTVAVLPWHVKRDGNNGPEIQDSHGVDYLLWKRPSKEWSSFQFRETLTHWALRWGNGYAEIERDQAGRPFAMWPIHPERVRCCRATEDEVDSYGTDIAVGDLYYEIFNSYGTDVGGQPTVTLAAANIFHLRGFGEGPVGVNVISYAAQSIGWARAAQLFGATFFGNGMNPAGVVMNKKPLKPDGLKRQKAEFDQLYKGPANANKTAFLDNDAEWKSIGFNARDAQLIEVHQYLVEEICRWFGVPPHKVQHLLRATFTNIESQGIEVVVDSIAPWVKRFEDEAEWKLFGQNRQNLYTKIDMRGLMRGDMASRIAYYKDMVSIGAFSPNRVLEIEDENTIGPDGDIHVMQNQNITLGQIAAPQNDLVNKYLGIKAKFDAYGVGVRAGSITPQKEDEESFRMEADLPDANIDVQDVWDDEPVRRPITLQNSDGSRPGPIMDSGSSQDDAKENPEGLENEQQLRRIFAIEEALSVEHA